MLQDGTLKTVCCQQFETLWGLQLPAAHAGCKAAHVGSNNNMSKP